MIKPPVTSTPLHRNHRPHFALAGTSAGALLFLPLGVSLIVALRLELRSRDAFRANRRYFRRAVATDVAARAA